MPRVIWITFTAITVLVLTAKVFADDAAEYVARAAQRLGHNDFDTNHDECLKAVSECDEAIAIDPKSAAAYCTRGRAQLLLHEKDKTLADCDKAIDLDPKFAEAYLVRGHLRIFTREYDKVIEDCDKAISLDPKLAEAFCHRGDAWREKGEYTKASADIEQALTLDPKLAEGYLTRGLIFLHKDSFEKAIVDLKRSVELSPNDWRTINNIGVTLWSQSQQQEARARIEDANGDQNTAQTRRQLAGTLKKQAITYWHHGLEVRPTATDILSNLGYAHSEAAAAATTPAEIERNTNQAEIYLKKAVRLNEEQARPHNNLGRLLLKRAYAWEVSAIQLEKKDKSDAKAAEDAKWAREQAKKLVAEATCEFERAIELEPKLLEAHINLGYVYESQKESEQAKNQYRAILKLQADKALDSDASASFSNAYFGLARVANALKQHGETVRNLQLALKLNPHNLDAEKMLVFEQYGAAEYSEGQSSLRTLLSILPAAKREPAVKELVQRLRDERKDEAAKRLENDIEP